jgi:hypothetical protein
MAFGLRQQGTFHFLLPDFRPTGRKSGNKKMVSTALPKAKNAAGHPNKASAEGIPIDGRQRYTLCQNRSLGRPRP